MPSQWGVHMCRIELHSQMYGMRSAAIRRSLQGNVQSPRAQILLGNLNSQYSCIPAVFFRINKSPTVARNVSVGSTQYLVLENVFTMEWKNAQAEKPGKFLRSTDSYAFAEQLTIWIRHCNTYCLRMFEQRGKEIPRFLLIGDPIGLFDETDGTTELSDGQQQEGNKITGDGIRTNSKMLQTHYLMVRQYLPLKI